MENFDKLPYSYDEDLKVLAYCPFCDVNLNPIKAKIIEGNGEAQLLHIQCQKCQGYILALVLRTQSGLSSIGLITDLNYADVFKFKNKKSLTADDVINIQQKINQSEFVQEIMEVN